MAEQAKQFESRELKPQDNFRALQVADMTTFMARLLFKLTESSVNSANAYIEQ